MTAGPFPVPEGVSLAGLKHGSRVSEAQALHLAGLPEFPEHWAIVPSVDGSRLALMWGDACTFEELGRSIAWNTAALAYVQAESTSRGDA